MEELTIHMENAPKIILQLAATKAGRDYGFDNRSGQQQNTAQPCRVWLSKPATMQKIYET
jgi:hypothetical protein